MAHVTPYQLYYASHFYDCIPDQQTYGDNIDYSFWSNPYLNNDFLQQAYLGAWGLVLPITSTSTQDMLSENSDAMLQASPQALAELEKLSQDYQPEVTGPLVGTLTSSQSLTQEYANADPIYVKKTTALAEKYLHYRTIRGDGNCGWRALAYGYLELVMQSNDQELAAHELARITSLNNVMEQAGFSEYLYEDFVEETLEALRIIGSMTSSSTQRDDTTLLDIFNTQEKSDAIITHLKLLTSAWIKTSPERYEPLMETTIAQYCNTYVEPYGVEIDHIGVSALIDCVIVPAGFAVEIFYLDRSTGEEVNIHRFEKIVDNIVQTPSDAPVIRILYRPGHYDLLYKNVNTPSQPTSTSTFTPSLNLQVNMMHSHRYYQQPFTSSLFNLQSHPSSVVNFDFSPEIPQTLPYPNSPLNDLPPNFRPSAFQYKAPADMPFKTKTFKNSHFNTSHFLNDNFQPEMYNPDQNSDEEMS